MCWLGGCILKLDSERGANVDGVLILPRILGILSTRIVSSQFCQRQLDTVEKVIDDRDVLSPLRDTNIKQGRLSRFYSSNFSPETSWLSIQHPCVERDRGLATRVSGYARGNIKRGTFLDSCATTTHSSSRCAGRKDGGHPKGRA